MPNQLHVLLTELISLVDNVKEISFFYTSGEKVINGYHEGNVEALTAAKMNISQHLESKTQISKVKILRLLKISKNNSHYLGHFLKMNHVMVN